MTQKNEYETDTLIVGLGAMGSAALYYLSKTGTSVIGIDRFSPPHDQGSTHGETRLIRRAYFEHPKYVPILKESTRLWKRIQKISKKIIFRQNGLLLGGAEGKSSIVEKSFDSARQHGVEVEKFNHSEMSQKFPYFHWPDNFSALYEPEAGYLFCENAVEFFLTHSTAQTFMNSPVTRYECKNNCVMVETDNEIFTAKKIIWTVGSWSSDFNSVWKKDLNVFRANLHWYEASTELDDIPCYGFDDGDHFFYGFPRLEHLKCALHLPEKKIPSPNNYDRSIEDHECEPIDRFVKNFFKNRVKKRVESRTCLYTMSHDDHFYFDEHPQDSRMFMAAGFSGHGFKFAPAIGQELARWATGEKMNSDFDFLKKSRP